MARRKQSTETGTDTTSKSPESVEGQDVATSFDPAQPAAAKLDLRSAMETLPFPETNNTCNVAIIVEFTRDPGLKERIVHRSSSGSLMVNAQDRQARGAVEHEIGLCLLSISRVIDGIARARKA